MHSESSAQTSHPPQHLSCPVIVGRDESDRWIARLLGWTECWAEGATREEALHRLEQQLLQQLSNMEVTHLTLPIPQPNNPLLKLAGKYKDDPEWDDYLAEIADYRQAIDAEQNVDDMNSEVA